VIDPAGRAPDGVTAESVREDLLAFLQRRTRNPVSPDLDIFSSGLASSLFALQLVVHLERSFGIAVSGPELQLDNFRTVDSMVALVMRLRGEQ
jgi:methoxymalonate biosynthesis acyl carrier protein